MQPCEDLHVKVRNDWPANAGTVFHSACRVVVLAQLLLCGCNPPPSPPSSIRPTSAISRGSSTPPSEAPTSRPNGTLPSFQMVGRESGFEFDRYDDIRGLR